MIARSYLFVPGDRPDMLAKAHRRGADAVIADLEDAVAPSRKEEARRVVAEWLADLVPGGPEAWVRVNHTADLLEDDLAAAMLPGLRGVMVPKVRSGDELVAIAAGLERRAAGAGLAPPWLLPIVETAAGWLDVAALAAAPRVHRLMIGEFDLAADLGVEPTDEAVLIPLRLAVVAASAAAGLESPVAPVSADFRDLDALRIETLALARRGFGGRPAIHPAQVPVINEAFTPDPDAVARARRLVARYDEALAAGRGSVTDSDGTMIDEAVVRRARRLLDRAGSDGSDS